MKKIMAMTLSAMMISSASHAWIRKGDAPAPVNNTGFSVADCSDYLYQRSSTFSSATDAACSFGRTDLEFRECTLDLAQKIGGQNIQLAGQACAVTRSRAEALCTLDLYYYGGLYIENRQLPVDGARVCAAANREQVKSCIVDQYQGRKKSGPEAARFCVEQFDPVAKARREAEQRRIEEERRRKEAELRAAEQRAAEQRRAEEQRRLEEQKRQEEKRRQDQQKAQEEEKRRQEEEKKKKEESQKKDSSKQDSQKKESQPSTPPPANDNGGGVIVDLPNFE